MLVSGSVYITQLTKNPYNHMDTKYLDVPLEVSKWLVSGYYMRYNLDIPHFFRCLLRASQFGGYETPQKLTSLGTHIP